MNIFKKRSGRATLGTLTLLLISAQGAWGQAGRGGVSGTVTDSSGAVVPGASVELTNIRNRRNPHHGHDRLRALFLCFSSPGPIPRDSKASRFYERSARQRYGDGGPGNHREHYVESGNRQPGCHRE